MAGRVAQLDPEARRAYMLKIASMPRKHYPWETARARFVEGVDDADEGGRMWETLTRVAEVLDIPARRVFEMSRRYGWLAQREEFKAELKRRVIVKKAEILSGARIHVDLDTLEAAEVGIRLCRSRLDEIGDDRADQIVARETYLALKAEGADAEALEATGYNPWQTSAVDARELASLQQALGGFHQIALRAVGAPDVQRVELTGAQGGPINLRTSVVAELEVDDKDRLAALFEMASRAMLGEDDDDVIEIDNVVEGELVPDV